jgi:thiol:disulfide interchange protein
MTTPARRGAISLANIIFLAVLVASIGVVLFIRGGGAAANNAQASNSLFQTANFAQAQQAAASEGKLVFVLATADWCGPCKSFRGGTLADPAVQDRINQVAVPYKLDVTNQTLPPHDLELAQRLNVGGIPAIYAIDQNNNVVAASVGNLSPTQFTTWLDGAAAK